MLNLPTNLRELVLKFVGLRGLFSSLVRVSKYFREIGNSSLEKNNLSVQLARQEVLNVDRIRNNPKFADKMRKDYGISLNSSLVDEKEMAYKIKKDIDGH